MVLYFLYFTLFPSPHSSRVIVGYPHSEKYERSIFIENRYITMAMMHDQRRNIGQVVCLSIFAGTQVLFLAKNGGTFSQSSKSERRGRGKGGERILISCNACIAPIVASSCVSFTGRLIICTGCSESESRCWMSIKKN
jgi:hypothetical protein